MPLLENKIYKLFFSIAFIFLIRAFIIYNYGPRVVPNVGDHPVYHSTAVNLSKDPMEWTKPGSEFGYRAPLYFIFLSAIYSTMREPKYQMGQILNAILGTISCLIIFLITRNYYNERTAWISFWIRGLLPPFILSDTLVLSEPLFNTIFFTALLILSLKYGKIKWFQSLGIGICMALCILTREAALLYPCMFLIILVSKIDGFLNKIGNIFIFCFCFFIVLFPWLMRNKFVWGKPFPLSYTAGVNLHIGNNYKANGIWILAPDDDRPKTIKFGTPEFNNWHMRKGIKYINENPVRFLNLGFKKIAWFLFPSFNRDELLTVYGLSNRNGTIFGIIMGISSAILIVIGVIGFVHGKQDIFWKISLILVIYYFIAIFITYGAGRYRDQIDNLLVIFMAQSIINWSDIKYYYNSKNKMSRRKLYIIIVFFVYLSINWIWVINKKI